MTTTNLSILGVVDSTISGLTVILSDGSNINVPASGDKYAKAKELLAEGKTNEFIELVNPRAKVSTMLAKSDSGRIRLEGGRVVDDTGMEIPTFLVNHLLWMAEDNQPLQPLLNFMDKLQENPSFQARTELGEWAIKAKMPITPDGNFLAYKKVNADYTSIHDGKFKNDLGTTVTMPGGRGAVDDNRNNHCSKGLHFCSKEYLPNFGSRSVDSARILLVSINPADVVSIPNDYNYTKGRAWRYTILADVTDKVGIDASKPLTTSAVYDYSDDDEDYDDFKDDSEY